MARLIAVGALVVFLLCCTGHVARAVESPMAPSLDVTVELQDGSRIVGTADPQTIAFESSSAGKMAVPLSALGSIERIDALTKYSFRNGEILSGVPGDGNLELDASYGRASIPMKLIVRATIAHPPLARFDISFADPGEAWEWTGFHSLSVPRIVDGAFAFEMAGNHPYLCRTNLKVPAWSCPALVITMKKDAGASMGVLYWTTDTWAGYSSPAYMTFKIPPDDQFHEITVPVGTNPYWRGVITSLRIDADSGNQRGRGAIRFVKAGELPPDMAAASAESAGTSIFDGQQFEAKPALAGRSVSEIYQHSAEDGFAYFFVRDAERSMIWTKDFGQVLDATQYCGIDLQYQAWELTDDGDAWILRFLNSRSGGLAGFTAVRRSDIIADGETHSLRVQMAALKPAGLVKGCAVQVKSGDIGWGSIFIHRLTLVGSPQQAESADSEDAK